MKPKKAKKYILKLRVDEEELKKVRVIMDIHGYPTVSCFLRDVIFKKKVLTYRKVERVTDSALHLKMNELIYNFNKIGVNYNQVVATYQKQAKMIKRDGSPFLNTRSIEDKIARLMTLTENMRDEFALILEVFKRYEQDTTCLQ